MRGDRISSLFSLLFGLFIMKEGFGLDFGELRHPGSGFFILFGGMLLVAFSSILLLQSFLVKQAATESDGHEEKGNPRSVLYLIISLIVYALTLEWLGFIICTFFLMTFLMMLFERKRWWVIILTAGSISLASYTFFTFVLQSELPKGILQFF